MELQPIITAAKTGDKEAFAKLYEITSQRALAYAITYLRLDIDEANDIVADAYIAAFEKLDTFEDGRDFYSWLFAIVRNKAIDLQRKKSKIIYDHERMLEILTEDSTTEEITQQQRETALHSLIDDLPDRQKEAVKLHYLEGLTVKETAERMGISENTAKTHIHRGFASLRDAITEDGNRETWLDGIAIMPLLSSLLRQDMTEGIYTVSAKATAKVLQSVGMKTAGAASVGSAGVGVATTGTGAAVTTASVPTVLGGIALTGGVKIAIAAVAAVLVAGGATGAYIYNEKQNEAVQAALIFQQEEEQAASEAEEAARIAAEEKAAAEKAEAERKAAEEKAEQERLAAEEAAQQEAEAAAQAESSTAQTTPPAGSDSGGNTSSSSATPPPLPPGFGPGGTGQSGGTVTEGTWGNWADESSSSSGSSAPELPPGFGSGGTGQSGGTVTDGGALGM